MSTRILVVEASSPAESMASLFSLLPQDVEVLRTRDREEALRRIAGDEVDLVFADGKAGVAGDGDLLQRARLARPEVLRLFVVDPIEREELGAAVLDAHGTIVRGRGEAAVRSEVVRAVELARRLNTPRLHNLLAHIDSLPTAPALWLEFSQRSKDPNTTVTDLGSIVQRDMGLTARVLAAVNSAIHGLRRTIVDPGEAASLMGLDALQSLILSVETMNRFDDKALKHFTVESVWQRSHQVAKAARAILEAERCDKRMVEEGYLAGLMHDCGELLLATCRADRFEFARTLALRDGALRHDLEARLFGVDHAHIGAHLMQRFGLPQGVIEAVAFHHEPSRWIEPDFSVLTAVHVASCAVEDPLREGGDGLALLDRAHLERTGRAARLDRWLELCRQA